MKKISDIKIIAISALMHDIGKVVQRTGKPKPPLGFSTEYANFARSSADNMRYGYIHSVFTHEFMDNHRDIFKPQEIYIGEQKDMNNIAWLSAKHHNPSTKFHKLIQKADILSAGFDRSNNYHKKGSYKTVRLNSIFDGIFLKSGEKKNYEYDLRELSYQDERTFPVKARSHDEKTSENEYKDLLDKFEKDIENFDIYSPWAISCLSSMLEKYTWCIPSSTIDVPDISLYCHSLTTAAFATSLYKFLEEQNNDFSESDLDDDNEKRFLFISGDISGIQNYIFSLKKENLRGVSKVLRARSFYIDKMVDILSLRIVMTLGLPLINRIMNAGGRFLILAQNTESATEKLKNIDKEINDWLFENFFGEINFNIDHSVSASAKDLKSERFSNLQDMINKSTETNKLRPFNYKIDNSDYGPHNMAISTRYDLLQKNHACIMCNKNPINDQYKDESLCEMCYNQKEKIGKKLPYTKFIAYHAKPGRDSIDFFDGQQKLCITLLKSSNELDDISETILIENVDPNKDPRYFPQKHIANYVPKFHDNELCKYYRNDSPECMEAQKYNLKTFGCIACSSCELIYSDETMDPIAVGRPLLGVLKADVDNLGKLFSVGLKNYSTLLSTKGYSISHYITLSNLLNNFFTGILQARLSERGSEYSDIYSVYSGGDDLLYIGPYDKTIKFAKSLNDLFKNFVCNNNDITISAGINIIPGNVPIYNAVMQADEILNMSKEYPCKSDPKKNAVTVFNTTVPWKKMPGLLEYKNKINDYLRDSKSKVSDSFLYRLLHYHKMFLSFIDNPGYVKYLKFKPLFIYDLYRNIAIEDSDGKIKNLEEINTFRELLKDPIEQNDLMKNLKIPLFLTLYKNRNINKRK